MQRYLLVCYFVSHGQLLLGQWHGFTLLAQRSTWQDCGYPCYCFPSVCNLALCHG